MVRDSIKRTNPILYSSLQVITEMVKEMKNVLGSEKNFYLTLSLPHTKYSIINIVSRFPDINSDEIDLISIYESISKELISVIPNFQFVYANKQIGISILLSPTENVEDFLLCGNIQHINSHIASIVTILLTDILILS